MGRRFEPVWAHFLSVLLRSWSQPVIDEIRQGPDWISRRVGANGVVSIAWQQISVGKHRGGHNVDVHIQKEMVQIWDGSELIKSALRNRPGEVIRKKNAQTTTKK